MQKKEHASIHFRFQCVMILLSFFIILFPLQTGAAVPDMLQFTAGGHVLGFEKTGFVMASGDHAVRVEFVDSNNVTPQSSGGSDQTSPGKAPPLEKVTYPDLWDGITLVYEQTGGNVKSTYSVAPGADVGRIRLRYNAPVETASDGSLRIKYENGYLTESPPAAWQVIDGKKNPVEVSFLSSAKNKAGFNVGKYNPSYALIIDPEYIWNTFLGASTDDHLNGMEIDFHTIGFYPSFFTYNTIFVTGTSRDNWGNPVNSHPAPGSSRPFAAMLDTAGYLSWNTFIGDQYSGALPALCSSSLTDCDHLYIGTAKIVYKLDKPTGAEIWNVDIIGNVNAYLDGIAVDNFENIYLTGISYEEWGQPLNPYSGSSDVFVAKLNSTGDLLWLTFLGSLSGDTPNAIQQSLQNAIFITGESNESWGNPVVNHSESAYGDAFVAKLSNDGELIWNTFLGFSKINDISANESSIYMTGSRFASGFVPLDGGNNIVVEKIDMSGNIVWYSDWGGIFDVSTSIEVDSQGNTYTTGKSNYGDWGEEPMNAHNGESSDIFILKLDDNGQLEWNTFLGCSIDDDKGVSLGLGYFNRLFIAGESTCEWGTPVKNYSGGDDVFIAEIPNYTDRPDVQTSNIHFSLIETNEMTISWNNGDGARRLVLVKNGMPVDAVPKQATYYSPDPAFGNGSEIGNDNYAVYSDSGSSVTVSGLLSNTNYHIAIFEYNGYGGTENYLTNPHAVANRFTLATMPASPASSVTFNWIAQNSMTVNWTNGNGANRIVVMREESEANMLPAAGMSYAANPIFGTGNQTGPGNYVVYNGSASSVTVSGLDANTTYHVSVYEYNGSGGSENFLTAAPAEGSQSTLAAEPDTQASAAHISSVSDTAMTLNWTNGSGEKRIVLMKAGGNVDAFPTDGTTYSANPAYGIGSMIGNGNFAVYSGTGNSVTVTGLTPSTMYYAAIYEFNGTEGYENYKTSFQAAVSRSTLAVEPAFQASNVNPVQVGSTGMNISWTPGSGTGRVVVMKKGGPVDADPQDGQNVTASSEFGTGDLLGNANYVVYRGTGSSVSVSGLNIGSAYHAAVYERNEGQNQNTENYLTPGAAASLMMMGHISVSEPSLSISEPDETDAFTLALDSDPSEVVTVNLSLDCGGEEGAAQLSHSSVTLNSGNWSAGETVTVSVIDNDTQDGERECAIIISPSDSLNPGFSGIDPPDIALTVQDDDTAGLRIVPSGPYTISELTGKDLEISLTSEPASNVSMSLISTDTGECAVSPLMLTFTPSNWSIPQTLRLEGIEDSLNDGTQSCEIEISVISSDGQYNGIAETLTVYVNDIIPCPFEIGSIYPTLGRFNESFEATVMGENLYYSGKVGMFLQDENGMNTGNEIPVLRSLVNSSKMRITIPALPDCGMENCNYTLRFYCGVAFNEIKSAITLASTIPAYKAVIAVGKDAENSPLWEPSVANAHQAYQVLLDRGFLKENIYYLSAENHPDIDGDGEQNDWDGPAGTDSLFNVLDETAAGEVMAQFVIYLVGHGGAESFRISPTQTLNAADLNEKLNAVQANLGIGGELIFIYDACYSGTFLEPLKHTPNRTVITSAGDHPSYFLDTENLSFSSIFWPSVFNRFSVGQCFFQAREMMRVYQWPLLDADGDGIGEEDEYAWVNDLYIGRGGIPASDTPSIASLTVTPDALGAGETSATVTAGPVTDTEGISKVWAVVVPECYSYGSPQNLIKEYTLTVQPKPDDDIYVATLPDFLFNGTYTISVYASDIKKNTSTEPAKAILDKTGGVGCGSPGDINQDTEITLADAILILKILTDGETYNQTVSDFANSGIDVNADDRAGLEEVIFILKDVAD